MPVFPPVTITIEGPHDSGRTTAAHLIKSALEENGYRLVTVTDTEPLPREDKNTFSERFERNKALRQVKIIVRTA
jgi:pantothenate kinase-related protein Tda10